MGAELSRMLNNRIDSMETESRTRADIIQSMGDAAGIDESTVNQILRNEIDCPPLERLSGFARALGVSASSVRGAAERDGCRYGARTSATELTIVSADDGGGSESIKVEGVAYSGGKMRIRGQKFPVVVDLSTLDIPATFPLLANHENSPKAKIGQSSAKTDGRKLEIDGKVLASNDAGREIVAQAKQPDFQWQLSIGADSSEQPELVKGSRTVNGQNIEGPFLLFKNATLIEVSVVAIGADTNNTFMRVAARFHFYAGGIEMNFEAWLKAHGIDASALTDEDKVELKASYDAGSDPDEKFTKKEDGSAGNISGGAVAPAVSAESTELAMIKAMQTERKRIAAIREICAGDNPELEAKAIDEGLTAEEIAPQVVKALRERRPVIGASGLIGTPGRANVTGQAVQAALMMSSGINEKDVGEDYSEKDMNLAVSDELRGIGLNELFHRTIEAAGMYARPGRMNAEKIRTAFEAHARLKAAADFSTVSLSLLDNVANKMLLQSFMAVNRAATRVAGRGNMSDFKTHTRYRLTSGGEFKEVGPDGEIKHGTVTDESYTNRLSTYAELISLTRQMIIDDDLGALMRIPQLLGRDAAIKLEEVFFTLLLANTGSFFSTDNGNYQEGATTNLQISSLTSAEQLLEDQTDSNGKPILVAADRLLVPTSLKVLAKQIQTDQFVNERAVADSATANPAPNSNPHQGKWEAISSPYLNSQGLTGSSALGWYLFTNPNNVAAFEIGYLNNRDTPTIESGETDFDTLGMRWRGYWDFGVAQQDPRGAVFSKGEA